MYSIQEETELTSFYECMELGRKHYEEVEEKSSTVPYKPNYHLLELMHQHKLISLVTARDAEGVLIGYIANAVTDGFFHDKKEAKELGIYVRPEYRGSFMFVKLLKLSQKVLRDQGVHSHYIMFKEGHDTGLASRLGYDKTETVYLKILEE